MAACSSCKKNFCPCELKGGLCGSCRAKIQDNDKKITKPNKQQHTE